MSSSKNISDPSPKIVSDIVTLDASGEFRLLTVKNDTLESRYIVESEDRILYIPYDNLNHKFILENASNTKVLIAIKDLINDYPNLLCRMLFSLTNIENQKASFYSPDIFLLADSKTKPNKSEIYYKMSEGVLRKISLAKSRSPLKFILDENTQKYFLPIKRKGEIRNKIYLSFDSFLNKHIIFLNKKNLFVSNIGSIAEIDDIKNILLPTQNEQGELVIDKVDNQLYLISTSMPVYLLRAIAANNLLDGLKAKIITQFLESGVINLEIVTKYYAAFDFLVEQKLTKTYIDQLWVEHDEFCIKYKIMNMLHNRSYPLIAGISVFSLFTEALNDYRENNFFRAFREFKLIADETEDYGAEYNVGVCLKEGIGVEKDLKNSVKYLRKAYKKKYANAGYALARCLEEDETLKEETDNIEDLYRVAAEKGNLGANYNYAHILLDKLSDPDKSKRVKILETALSCLRYSALLGHDEAQYCLGVYLYQGKIGDIECDKDQVVGLFYLSESARQGNKDAVNYLSILLANENNPSTEVREVLADIAVYSVINKINL